MKTFFTALAITAALAAQAGNNFSLIEINPQHGTELWDFSDSNKMVYGAGELSGFTELNGELYFYAQGATDDGELWATDGTQAGSRLVKDINPHGSAMITDIVRVGNHLMFMAADNNNWDFDLWTSDGTEAGTVKLVDVNQGWNNLLNANNIAVTGNRMIFCTPTALMITDGTPTGTDSLAAITTYSQGFGYCELNGNVYFVLSGMNGKLDIWATDGTASGTKVMTTPSNQIAGLNSIYRMLSFNGKIYVHTYNSGTTTGYALYTYDGSPNGQLQPVNLPNGGVIDYADNMKIFDNALYFTGSDMTSANIYRITNSSPNPEALLQGPAISWLSHLTYLAHSIYFVTESQQQIHRIDLSTLQHTVTDLPGHSIPYYYSSFMVSIGNDIFFIATDTATYKQILVRADVSLQDIHKIMPANVTTDHPFNRIMSCGFIDLFDLKTWGDKLIVPANFNDAGRELWIYESKDVVGIKDLVNDAQLNIFPNPSTGAVTIKTLNNGYCEQEFFVRDVQGGLVMQGLLSNTNNSINISNLPSGNYCFTVTENGTAIGTKKVTLTK